MAAAIAADVLCLAMSAVGAYWLSAFVSSVAGWEYSSALKVFNERSLSLPLLATGVICWFFLLGHYHTRAPFWDEAGKVATISFAALTSEGFFLFAWKADGSRLATFATWMLMPFAVMLGRALLRRILRLLDLGEAKAVVVGRPSEAAAAARVISADRHLGYTVCGTLHTTDAEVAIAEATRLAADTVVIALSGDDALENAVAPRMRSAGFRVILVPPVTGFASSGMKMQYVIGQDSILLVDKVDVTPRLSRFAKRLFDIGVTSAALMLAVVPMVGLAVLVKLDGGPALFGHERVGLCGRRFRCMKFRSMAVDSGDLLARHLEEDPDARLEWLTTQKLKRDPRVTPLGKFMRKSALDELPQLLNVLRGDMSLVGPRPVTEPELEHYGAAADLYLSVRPGVTGLWQVSGRNDLSYEQRVGLDAWYVNNWSPWHDTAIILKTIPALLFRRGAY